MRKISISKDIGVYDIGKVREVETIISQIEISETEVQINLDECLIDYPATGKLMDAILSQLEKTGTDRKVLRIVYDCDLSEATLLNWLFLGSTFFNISEKKELGLDELKPAISKILSEKNIVVQICIQNFEGVELKNYSYE